MKKLFFILSLSLTTIGAFASNEVEQEFEPVTKCCTRSANNGKEGAAYISVTVTMCTTSASGNGHAASAHACSNALTNAQKSVSAIEDFSVTITNQH